MQQETLQLLIEEDSNTQKKVYYEHCDWLMNLIYGYTQSIPDAEEVLQDTFLALFKNIKAFDFAKGTFKGWCRRIAINKALMFLRKKRQILFVQEDITQMTTQLQEMATPPKDWSTSDLIYFLNQLPLKSSIVFQLKVLEGYSHEEIADLLNIKNEVSRAIFSRARKRLRLLMSDWRAIF